MDCYCYNKKRVMFATQRHEVVSIGSTADGEKHNKLEENDINTMQEAGLLRIHQPRKNRYKTQHKRQRSTNCKHNSLPALHHCTNFLWFGSIKATNTHIIMSISSLARKAQPDASSRVVPCPGPQSNKILVGSTRTVYQIGSSKHLSGGRLGALR